MRNLDATTLAHLDARGGIVARSLIWFEAKNRTTGLPETLGLWSGADNRAFTIGGQVRDYFGAGGLMNIEPVTFQVGLSVRMQRADLSPITAETAQLLRTYDPRHAPVEIHRALFDPETGALVAEPHRVFKGRVDSLEIITPEEGGTGAAAVTLASSARELTRALPTKRSDGSQQLRQGDRFFRYADVSGAVNVYWGTGPAYGRRITGGGGGGGAGGSGPWG